jgi:hypothetical protein
MYCIECGQAQPVKDAQFCPFCGTALHHSGVPLSDAASSHEKDPVQWVPLHNRGEQLRARLRWAIRVAVVLLFAMAGAGAWWWATQPDQPMAEEGVEVERIEAPAPAPAPASTPASTPTPKPSR